MQLPKEVLALQDTLRLQLVAAMLTTVDLLAGDPNGW